MTKLGMVIINYNDYKTTSFLLDSIKDYLYITIYNLNINYILKL